MSSFNALHLLTAAANLYKQQKMVVSRQEIVKKINEIKYLSAQKKIPKLSLRKEIIHLENTLQGIFEVEKALTEQKRKESAKVNSLKQQIKFLQKKLTATEDKDLQKKVDKLHHLLAECVAKRDIKKDVALQEAIVKEKEQPIRIADTETKLRALRYRLDALKQSLNLQKMTASPEKINNISLKINGLEQKIRGFHSVSSSSSLLPLSKDSKVSEVHHTFIFQEPQQQTLLSIEKELPLPPPPKRRTAR